jgi:hypothetical protein
VFTFGLGKWSWWLRHTLFVAVIDSDPATDGGLHNSIHPTNTSTVIKPEDEQEAHRIKLDARQRSYFQKIACLLVRPDGAGPPIGLAG